MEKQCARYDGKGWHCSNMASPGSIHCEKHRLERYNYNQKKRNERNIETRYITHLPSGELRCTRTRKQWQCHEKATSGVYCDKHGLKVYTRAENPRNGPPRQNHALGQGQSNYSGNGGSNSDQLTGLKLTREENRANNIEDVITNPNTKGGVEQVNSGAVESGEPTMQQQCRQGGKRGECLEMTSPGKLYCDSHQLEWDTFNKMRRKGPEKEVSSVPVKPGREVTNRQAGRKRLSDKETISANLVSGLGEMAMKKCRGVSFKDEHEESGRVGTQKTASLTCDPNMEITSREASMKFQEAQVLFSFANCYKAFEGHISTVEQVHIEKTSEVIDEDMETTHDYVDIEKYNQIKGIEPDNITITCVKSPTKCQNSQNLSHGAQLQNAIDDEQNDAVMLPFVSDYDNHEELQENEGLSLVTDGGMNAVNFSCERMEAEKDTMEVLAGVQSAVHVGDILIPAEYEHIYKEIKNLHGPLENGGSVGEKRSLSHATLVELLKVAHELESLTMESMTEATISNFEKTVAIGKLFNYNVGWLDENVKRVGDLYAKYCALGGELEEVERKITEEKHEEDILKLEVNEIDENIRVLEESINKMKQRRELIEKEKRKKYSNVSSLQERILETSKRICDTNIEFYRIAAKRW